MKRSVIGGAAAFVLLVSSLFGFATSASAEDNVVTGVATCVATPTSATFDVTWTVTNDSGLTEAVTATSATGGLSTLTGSPTTIGASGSGTLTQVLPGATTGSALLSIVSVWSDDVTVTDQGSVVLPGGGCSATGPSATCLPVTSIAALAATGRFSETFVVTGFGPTQQASGTLTLSGGDSLCSPVTAAVSYYSFDTTTSSWPQTNRGAGLTVTVEAPGTYAFASPIGCGQDDAYITNVGPTPTPPANLLGPNNPSEPAFVSAIASGPVSYSNTPAGAGCTFVPPTPTPPVTTPVTTPVTVTVTPTVPSAAPATPTSPTGPAPSSVTTPVDAPPSVPVVADGSAAPNSPITKASVLRLTIDTGSPSSETFGVPAASPSPIIALRARVTG